jgi:hypothetical protein
MVSQMEDFTSSRAFRVAGPKAFAGAGIYPRRRRPSDDLRRPCSLPGASFAHLPIYGLEDLGFVPRGEADAFIAERNTSPGVPGTARRAGRPGSRSTPMAAASPTCIPACTACMRCRRACARCAASLPPRSPMPRSRSDTVCAACSPPPAPSLCRTSRRHRQESLTAEAAAGSG